MSRYSDDVGSIDRSGNQLLLGKTSISIRIGQTGLFFLMAPIGSSTPSVTGPRLQKALRSIERVKPPYLQAAFARAILPYLIEFLRNPTNKYLIGDCLSQAA